MKTFEVNMHLCIHVEADNQDSAIYAADKELMQMSIKQVIHDSVVDSVYEWDEEKEDWIFD